MALKVVFIFPGIAEAGFSKKRQAQEYSWINHGLCSLSACAKEKGHKVELIDLRELSGWDDVKEEIQKKKPDVVGITMMTVDYDPALQSAKIAKACGGGIKVVVGGPHPSIMTDEVAALPYIDHIIVGEGEISFIKLLGDIENGIKPNRIIQGEQPDLDKIPLVDRALFNCRESPIEPFLPVPFVTIIAGRGCIYNCSFCQPAERSIFGKKVRRRSVSNIMKELKMLRDMYDFQSFMFHDDCLTENREWIAEFCNEYRKEKFKKPFICQSRADIICKNQDMIRLMRKAGLCMLLIGFESGNNRILKFLRKGSTVDLNLRAAKICKKLGVRVWANYMMGIPTETKDEVMDTVKMILKIKPHRPSPAFFTPHPGSDLYDYCVKNNLSLIKSHGDFSRTPHGAKVKGIDYTFLQDALKMSKKRFLSVRLARKVDFLRERRVKQFFRHRLKILKKVGD